MSGRPHPQMSGHSRTGSGAQNAPMTTLASSANATVITTRSIAGIQLMATSHA